ncbi:UNVERIFIED_CONTAM: hypothetical protein HDU68_006478 [Siphonaria sp. JEL0065]|nr:hypothetical protein HDU68_006478 [Siphonaria sp. JEL0065]
MPADLATIATIETAELESILANHDPNSENNTITETYKFNTPKDFDSPYIDVLARELYRRDIITNKGSFYEDGRLKTWPAKQSKWEAVIRYIGTLIDPSRKLEQSEVMAVIRYFVPANLGTLSPTNNAPDASMILRNLVDMGILEREAGGVLCWRTVDRGHPKAIGQGIIPRF